MPPMQNPETSSPPSLSPWGGKPKPAALQCHRLSVPLAIPTPTGKKNLQGQAEMQVVPQVARIPCTQELCALWNPLDMECYDVSQAKALGRIRDQVVAPDGD